jgi:galactoside O-acetyltransferase
MATLARSVVESMGFLSLSENVLISDRASFYNRSKISLGSNVRIVDFCTLSAGDGGIGIGSYVHIAMYSGLMGNVLIILEDFSGLSSRVSIYSSNDGYSGRFMTNPADPQKYTTFLKPLLL